MNCRASLAALTVTAACETAAVSSQVRAMIETPSALAKALNAAMLIRDDDTALKYASPDCA
jgi:hypothetical protein